VPAVPNVAVATHLKVVPAADSRYPILVEAQLRALRSLLVAHPQEAR
jgi:hypothetical protein